MKKILSVITAVSIAMLVVLPALTVSAAEKITADEVKEMIYSSGLRDYPGLWDMPISEAGVTVNVSNPDTRTVKDVIDVNNCYREFFLKNTSGKFSVNYDDNVAYIFTGLDENKNRVRVTVFADNYIIPENAGTALYESVLYADAGLAEDYGKIAEIINESDIEGVADIKLVNSTSEYLPGTCIYIKDSNDKEYAVSVFGYTKTVMENLSDNVKSIEKGRLMDFNAWCAAIEGYDKEDYDRNSPQFETVEGDEIRDTDTRAAYIGAESIFSDVSGDLISYVNELNDLGIIYGYDENIFMPDNNITRAEAASMLARMFRYSGKYSAEFNDVSADDWFADDVLALAAAGVINGYSETTFAPYENIKYQEVMKILVCALGYGSFRGFGSNAYPLMTNQKAMQIGLTNNLQSFDTTAPITRGDMAIMLSNALDTHLFTTVRMIPKNGVGGGISQQDITLIDYLSGKKLNGTLTEASFD